MQPSPKSITPPPGSGYGCGRDGRGVDIPDELVSGRADFAVDMPAMLIERQKGRPIVALAAIFQHSPEALFALQDSGITNPHDLAGRTIMLRPDGNAEIRAMLASEGIKKGRVRIVPHTWDINDLTSGRVAAAAGYLTDRPFILRQMGVDFTVLRPISYGIDFYGDCLFTTEKEIREHPELVKKFLAASLRGWEYAMTHPEEIADLIIAKYPTRLSRAALLHEAKTMRELMQPRFIEIGHMNPGRWRHIADTLVKLGMLDPGYSLEGFLYRPGPQPLDRRILWGLLAAAAAAVLAGVLLLLFNRRLSRAVALRTRELEEARRFIEVVIETLPGIFYVYEDGKRMLSWNRNLRQRSGLSEEEIRGRHPLDWVVKKDREKVAHVISALLKGGEGATEAVEAVEAELELGGKTIPYYLTGAILRTDGKIFLIGVGIDITEQRRLEEQLRQAQKMESIGRLAGGVAHDFNNVLTTILGYSELLIAGMEEADPRREQVEIIRSAGRKAAALTRQLLAFSRKQILEIKALAINTVVSDLLKILGKMLGEDISVTTELTAEGTIEADPGQIEQVLMNLAVNARDAMPDGGTLLIETADTELGEDYVRIHPGVTAGAYVCLTVSDNGSGMDRETLNHIFDPFFTTKEKGKGTGLGLATVYGIVRQHNGHIYVYSEPSPAGALPSRYTSRPATSGRRKAGADETPSPCPAGMKPFWWWTTMRTSAG